MFFLNKFNLKSKSLKILRKKITKKIRTKLLKHKTKLITQIEKMIN